MLSALITLLVSRRQLHAVRERLQPHGYRVPEQRWAAVMASVAHALLDIVLLPQRIAGALAARLEPMMLDEASDPNRNRASLIERVETGALWT